VFTCELGTVVYEVAELVAISVVVTLVVLGTERMALPGLTPFDSLVVMGTVARLDCVLMSMGIAWPAPTRGGMEF